MSKTHIRWRIWAQRLLSTATLLCVALALRGCTPEGGGTPTPSGQLSGQIVNLTSNIRLSGAQMFTMVYNASTNATSVSAFFVPVASTAADAAEVGPEVIFNSNLPTGTGQTTNLNTESLATGIYRLGITLTAGSDSLRVLSTGSIEITELQDPVFELPNQPLAILPGTAVNIRADLGDPENAVQWRLFYIEASAPTDGVPADQLGAEITTGSTNVAVFTWNTGGIPLGDYRIGISVTDSGQSIAQTVAAGQSDRIRTVFNDFIVQLVGEAPQPHPPSVAVTQPSGKHNILEDESVQIVFSVTVFEGPPDEQSVLVFMDSDGVADTGDETILSDNLPITATSAALAGSKLAVNQTVHIGVTADDGKNDPVTAYANGTVTRVTLADATLTVTQPNAVVNRRPGEAVNVAWQTTVPSSAKASTNVRVRRLNAAGQPSGDEVNVSTTGLPLTQTTYTYDALNPGRFMITVEIVFTDGTPTLSGNAPQLVIVSTQPAIRWLGDLVDQDPTIAHLEGAVLEGVQFEDNAGSSMDGGEDFDGDGIEDFIIAARYAKPEFVNPTGIGIGEADLIRGRGLRYSGTHNLNETATNKLPGIVFTGVDAIPPGDTEGMARVFITGDADGDGIGEIAFGFPFVSSTRQFELGGQNASSCGFNPWRGEHGEMIPQFHRGGVVIDSSLNKVVSQSDEDTRGVRVPLELVGQLFQGHKTTAFDNVSPEPDSGDLCSDQSSWMADAYAWDDGQDCPGANCGPSRVGCIFGQTDGEQETLLQPIFGFDGRLADPYICTRYPFHCPGHWSQCPSCDNICSNGCGCNPLDPDNFCPQSRQLCEEGSLTLCDPNYECTPLDNTDPPEVRCECEEQKDLAELTFMGTVGIPLVQSPDSISSGFYRERISGTKDDNPEDIDWNDALEDDINIFGLIGARMIGRYVDDAAGSAITQSGSELIIASPYNSNSSGLDDGVGHFRGNGYFVRFTPVAATNRPTGLPLYWFIPNDPDRSLHFDPNDYSQDRAPPSPHQYLVGGESNGGIRPESTSSRTPWDTNVGWPTSQGVRIVGNRDELIENMVGIPDFNQDGRPDIAIGAPRADIDGDGSVDGAVYIIFRRQQSLEGNYQLVNLRRNTSDPERLSGLMVRESLGGGQRFGESVAGGFDFNHDGREDVVVGNPDGNGASGGQNATGEIVIIFGSANTISQTLGIPVESDAGGPGLLARGQGARIRGIEAGSEFGYNVANIGDIDGDGENDLAIAAPNASPYFDSNTGDSNDSIDPNLNSSALRGLDRNLDGVRDDVSGPTGIPDGSDAGVGNSDVNDELRHAGLVYVILSSTFAQDFAPAGGSMDISINQLGTTRLQGFIIVGYHGDRFANRTATTFLNAGDFLGGGFAGETTRTVPTTTSAAGINNVIDYGGNTNKGPVLLDQAKNIYRHRDRPMGINKAGDIDGDGLTDFIIGAQLADPRIDPTTGQGTKNAGEAYVVYGAPQE